jgi:hypothetical protein
LVLFHDNVLIDVGFKQWFNLYLPADDELFVVFKRYRKYYVAYITFTDNFCECTECDKSKFVIQDEINFRNNFSNFCIMQPKLYHQQQV